MSDLIKEIKVSLFESKAENKTLKKENDLLKFQLEEMGVELRNLRKEIEIERSKNIDSEYLSGKFFRNVKQ